MATLAPLEIQALVKIMDELSYYQMLHVEPDASSREIKKAYYATARTYHPDANRHLSEELQGGCLRVSKCITEAYCVLRDPRKRRSYDQKIAEGESIRMQLAEAKAAHARTDAAERGATTAQGKQFLHKAEDAIKREDHASVIQNIQMALTFERENEYFKELLEVAKKKSKRR